MTGAECRAGHGVGSVAGSVFRRDTGTKVENRPGEIKTTQKPEYRKT